MPRLHLSNLEYIYIYIYMCVCVFEWLDALKIAICCRAPFKETLPRSFLPTDLADHLGW